MALGVLVATPAAAHEERARITGVIDWVTWAPGDKILFQSSKGVFSISANGRDLRRVAGHGVSGASWSKQGAIVFRSGGEDGGISVARADGARPREIHPRGDFPAWSPRGDRIAFSTLTNIWVIDADGTGVRRVATVRWGTSYHSGPRWSPDGRRVVYSACTRPVMQDECDDRDAMRVFVAPVSRRGSGRVVARGHCPDWSRQGYLAYETAAGVVISRGSSSSRRLAIRKPRHCPSWSPQGTRVAAETSAGLAVGDFARTRLVARLPRRADVCGDPIRSAPAWSTDGNWVAVVREIGDCLRTTRTAYNLYVIRVADGKARLILRSPPS